MRFAALARLGLLTGLLLLAGCTTTGGETGTGGGGAGGGGGGTGGGTGGAGGSTNPPQPLTVVNWNVYNFVDNHLDIDEWVDPQWTVHRAAVGDVLTQLDADLVMLQEVESLAVLSELNELELGGTYEVRLIEGNDPRHIHLGLLSKLPIAAAVSHATEQFTKEGTSSPIYRYARDCLEIHVDFNGRRVILLGVHFKAKENDDPDKRLAEAQYTRHIADQLQADQPAAAIVILGDFNDLPGSPAYLATIGQEPQRYLSAAEHESIPAEDQWTFDFEGSHELVDHHIANPILGAMIESGTILHGDDIDAASDHAPISVTYQVY